MWFWVCAFRAWLMLNLSWAFRDASGQRNDPFLSLMLLHYGITSAWASQRIFTGLLLISLFVQFRLTRWFLCSFESSQNWELRAHSNIQHITSFRFNPTWGSSFVQLPLYTASLLCVCLNHSTNQCVCQFVLSRSASSEHSNVAVHYHPLSALIMFCDKIREQLLIFICVFVSLLVHPHSADADTWIWQNCIIMMHLSIGFEEKKIKITVSGPSRKQHCHYRAEQGVTDWPTGTMTCSLLPGIAIKHLMLLWFSITNPAHMFVYLLSGESQQTIFLYSQCSVMIEEFFPSLEALTWTFSTSDWGWLWHRITGFHRLGFDLTWMSKLIPCTKLS